MLIYFTNFFRTHSSVRYLLTGGFNTVMSLLLYYLLIKLHMHYLIASAITNVFGIIEGFLLNSWIVFNKRARLYGLLKYSGVYAVSWILNMFLMYMWVEWFLISQYIAPIITTIILTVINYILIKQFVFDRALHK